MESVKPLPYGVFQLSIETTHGIFGCITRTDLGCRRKSFLSSGGSLLHHTDSSVGLTSGGSHYRGAPGSCQITNVGNSGFNWEQISE